jgi:polyhydroxyalkanoate synthase
MIARGDERIASATYFVTLVDFADAGDMAVFIDKEQLDSVDERTKPRGYLEAHDMTISFNMLRSNDMIWSYVVRNYILGKEHLPFDLLSPPYRQGPQRNCSNKLCEAFRRIFLVL